MLKQYCTKTIGIWQLLCTSEHSNTLQGVFDLPVVWWAAKSMAGYSGLPGMTSTHSLTFPTMHRLSTSQWPFVPDLNRYSLCIQPAKIRALSFYRQVRDLNVTWWAKSIQRSEMCCCGMLRLNVGSFLSLKQKWVVVRNCVYVQLQLNVVYLNTLFCNMPVYNRSSWSFRLARPVVQLTCAQNQQSRLERPPTQLGSV